MTAGGSRAPLLSISAGRSDRSSKLTRGLGPGAPMTAGGSRAPLLSISAGRSDRSSKLTRGLGSEAAAGFRSRRALSHDDSAPVSSQNAPFPSYKAARVHLAARWRGGMAARGAGATAGSDAAYRRAVAG